MRDLRMYISLVFLLLPFLSCWQIVYTSPFTHTYPNIFTSSIEDVNRNITFEPNTITIATETAQGKEIEILTVREVLHYEGKVSMFCTTRNNRHVTIALPEQERVEIIDYFSQDPKTKEDYQLRFYVEREFQRQ